MFLVKRITVACELGFRNGILEEFHTVPFFRLSALSRPPACPSANRTRGLSSANLCVATRLGLISTISVDVVFLVHPSIYPSFLPVPSPSPTIHSQDEPGPDPEPEPVEQQ